MLWRIVGIALLSVPLAGCPKPAADQDVPRASSPQSATVKLAFHTYIDGGIGQGSAEKVWFAPGWYLLTFDPKSSGRQPVAIVQHGGNVFAMLAYNEGDPLQEYWQIFEVGQGATLNVSAVAARVRVHGIEVNWSPSGGHPSGG